MYFERVECGIIVHLVHTVTILCSPSLPLTFCYHLTTHGHHHLLIVTFTDTASTSSCHHFSNSSIPSHTLPLSQLSTVALSTHHHNFPHTTTISHTLYHHLPLTTTISHTLPTPTQTPLSTASANPIVYSLLLLHII